MDSQRFLIVTGKGGVGKTTVSAVLARVLADRGKRVLVAMCNAKERLSHLMGSPPIGHEVMKVAPNVWAVNMNPDIALEEYGAMALRSRALYKVLFDNKYVRGFLRAVPGMQEWTLLGKAWWHTTEEENGHPKYDVVILDAPATGHGIDMLRVPKIIVDVVPTGILRRDAERAWLMFQDPAQTGVVLVTLPEELPTTETIELAGVLTGELSLPLARLVINGVMDRLFTPAEGEALAAQGVQGAGTPARGAIEAAVERASRERKQAESMQRLGHALSLRTTVLPLLFEEASTPAAVGRLAQALSAQAG